MNSSEQILDNPEFPDRFIRIPELCKLIAVKRGTLYNIIKSGELKPIKLRGTVLFSKQQVIQWMKDKAEGK